MAFNSRPVVARILDFYRQFPTDIRASEAEDPVKVSVKNAGVWSAGIRRLWKAEAEQGRVTSACVCGRPQICLSRWWSWITNTLPGARVPLRPLCLCEAAETSSAKRTAAFVSVAEDVVVSFLAVSLFFADVANPILRRLWVLKMTLICVLLVRWKA